MEERLPRLRTTRRYGANSRRSPNARILVACDTLRAAGLIAFLSLFILLICLYSSMYFRCAIFRSSTLLSLPISLAFFHCSTAFSTSPFWKRMSP